MKVSYNWLKQYIDINISPEELAAKLTMAGIEVEAVHDNSKLPEGIVAAKIVTREQHPDADKLSVCKVDTGKEKLQVICGAPNCDVGVVAPLALIGTVLGEPDAGKQFKIKKSKLRGIESFGMLCSVDELGLGGDHSGIMELPRDTEIGTPLNDILESDVVFELEITCNRPDWLSHWGIARDIAALIGSELKFPEINLPEHPPSAPEGLIKIEDKDLCPRYTGRMIRNVAVKESPEWLKERLLSIGLRPINNIVDITNYVLMELGQPLHAFDFDLLEGGRIIVRRARENEKITALDGEEYELGRENLVIADAEKPVALAGVMGGEHSGVTGKTVNVLLESACFKPSNIRETSSTLGLSSDSSYRFERGIDPGMVETASDRATALILELAGGEIASELVDEKTRTPRPEPLLCRFEKMRDIVGCEISNHEIIDIFERLGISTKNIEKDSCVLNIPSFRPDIYREADLAEEIARIHGLDRIPEIPVGAKTTAPFVKDAYSKMEEARDQLIALGLWECVNYTLTDENSALKDTRFSKEDLKQLSNPISSEQAFLRPGLFHGMLENVGHNISRQNNDLAIFELGRVFCANQKLFPEERNECCIMLTGRKHPERYSSELEDVYDFYDMKGLLEAWFEKRKIENVSFEPVEDSRFASGETAAIMINGRRAGALGKVPERYTLGMRLKNPLYAAVIDEDMLLGIKNSNILYKPVPLYPETVRDVAFIAKESLSHREIVDFIFKAKVKNLEKVQLFDVFRDKKVLGPGKKSLAYSLTFRNSERTLRDKEVNKAHEKLRSLLAKEFNIELR